MVGRTEFMNKPERAFPVSWGGSAKDMGGSVVGQPLGREGKFHLQWPGLVVVGRGVSATWSLSLRLFSGPALMDQLLSPTMRGLLWVRSKEPVRMTAV